MQQSPGEERQTQNKVPWSVLYRLETEPKGRSRLKTVRTTGVPSDLKRILRRRLSYVHEVREESVEVLGITRRRD